MSEEQILQGRNLDVSDPDPWEADVELHWVLEDICGFFKDHLILPPYGELTMSLWATMTWLVDVLNLVPYIGFSSPLERAGKTNGLEAIWCLVKRPIMSANISAAALYRVIEEVQPTLLVDEYDTSVRDEALRNVMNGGYRRMSGNVLRCVPPDNEVRQFYCFGPKVIGLIGKLPRTIEDRTIAIDMQRKKRTEHVKRFSQEAAWEAMEPSRRMLCRWALDHQDEFRKLDPDIPKELGDREVDNWRILLAIADHEGGDWPKVAREAALSITGSVDENASSPRRLLLEDIYRCFQHFKNDRLRSQTIVDHLLQMEERPYGDISFETGVRPKQLNSYLLAGVLKDFKIWSKHMKFGDKTYRGYKRNSFQDAWERNLDLDKIDSVQPAKTVSLDPTKAQEKTRKKKS